MKRQADAAPAVSGIFSNRDGIQDGSLMPNQSQHQDPSALPQWDTSYRLLKLGEDITFHFSCPDTAYPDHFEIFPRYLETADPGDAFVAGGDPDWLDELEKQRIGLTFTEGRASVTYTPKEPGSYMARWWASGQTFYRYFSVVEDDWIVLRFSGGYGPEPEPSLHATGIPLDYRLPIEQFDPNDPLYQKLLSYHRHYGDLIVPVLPDTPDLSETERMTLYGDGLARVRELLPDPDSARSVRIEMMHEFDPGYTNALEQLGVNNHAGLWQANARPWLGMPEFPYFCSPIDCRKPNQGQGGAVVSNAWDFCGGWHFLGPNSWHYRASRGRIEEAAKCLRQGMQEAQILAELSGHPAFLYPLYDGFVPHPKLRIPPVQSEEKTSFEFGQSYQRMMAFEFPKEFKVVYARSIDVADYYSRHFEITPRTIFVSKTDHVMYDTWWQTSWYDQRMFETRERMPWSTRISSIMRHRNSYPKIEGKRLDEQPPFKDPLSYEFILIEDQKRSIRFERECPNPIWWFDYTGQQRSQEGSAITWTETPDVEIHLLPWSGNANEKTITLEMETDAQFANYAIALWDLPDAFDPDGLIKTSAAEQILTRNTDGEHHLVLFFDLKPGVVLNVTIPVRST